MRVPTCAAELLTHVHEGSHKVKTERMSPIRSKPERYYSVEVEHHGVLPNDYVSLSFVNQTTCLHTAVNAVSGDGRLCEVDGDHLQSGSSRRCPVSEES